MATTLTKNQVVKFNYKSKEGQNSIVDTLYVDRVFVSNDGYEIVQGFLDDGATEGRAYRTDGITDLEVL